MQDARVRGALIAICLACLIGSGFVLWNGRQSAPPIVISAPPSAVGPTAPNLTPPVTADSAAIARHSARLYVDVAGAVRRPSLYILPPNSRVMQAVMAAGGPTAAADMDAVNLAQIVTDGEKVFVPKHSASPPASLPAVTAAAAVIPGAAAPASHTKTGKGGSASGKISADSGEQISLNSATAEQLERLPGVGPSMAARILAYRQQAGGFGKTEDLMLVTGIGPKKFAKIAPYVTLN